MEAGWKEGNCVERRRKPGGLKRKWEGTKKLGGKKEHQITKLCT